MLLIFLPIAFFLIAIVYLNSPKFGTLPKGEDLERIEKSPNYKNGEFQNQYPTTHISEDASTTRAVLGLLFKRYPNTKPKKPIPTIKTDLQTLDKNKNLLIWFGHSSYLFQINGKRFLVDPVFSKRMSPVPFGGTAFKGTDIYTPADLPEIDYLIITHDHWDHLNYETVCALKSKVKKVICGLGVGAHLKHWKFDKNQIIELDWFETNKLEDELTLYALPARHFSGRNLWSNNKSLWMSYLIDANGYKIYMGGDSGYDDHYKKIGETFGSIDIAMLECGQYDKSWKYVHEKPQETIKAAKDLNTKHLLAVHNSKFAISRHPWNEPLKYLSIMSADKPYKLLTPKIGQKVELKKDIDTKFEVWWND